MKQQSPGPGTQSRCAAKHAYQASGASHYAEAARPKTAHTSLPTPSHIYATAVHTGVQAGHAAAHRCCRKAHTHKYSPCRHTPPSQTLTSPSTTTTATRNINPPHHRPTLLRHSSCCRVLRPPLLLWLAPAPARLHSAIAAAVLTRASASLTPQ